MLQFLSFEARSYQGRPQNYGPQDFSLLIFTHSFLPLACYYKQFQILSKLEISEYPLARVCHYHLPVLGLSGGLLCCLACVEFLVSSNPPASAS